MISSDAGWSGLGADPKARWVPPPPRAAASLARFIPREELQGFASWQPGAFGGDGDGAGQGFMPLSKAARSAPADPGAPAAEPALAQGQNGSAHAQGRQPQAPADDGPAGDASQLAAQAAADTEARHQADLQQARQAGYQDGYRDGLVALDSFKESFAQQMAAQVGQLLQSFDQELGQLEQRLASRVAQVATELARQVVRGELQQRPALVADVAQQAINALLASARQITVQLHPDDLPLVRSGCAELLAARGARLVGLADVARGGCLVEADLGQVDAGMATRWAQAAQAIGCDLPWQDPTARAAGTDTDPGADTSPDDNRDSHGGSDGGAGRDPAAALPDKPQGPA